MGAVTGLGVQSATHFMEASNCLNKHNQLLYFLYLEHIMTYHIILYISISTSNKRQKNPESEGRGFFIYVVPKPCTCKESLCVTELI